MKATHRLTRREFVQLAASAAVAGASVSCGKLASPWRTLTAGEAETLSSLCAQIIPGDQDPGALSAGVVNYIDVQLTSHLKRMKRVYRRGLAELNDRSVEQYGNTFSRLSVQQQIDFLTAIDHEKGWNGSSLKNFFHIVVDHTMQGFYGDPRHGGNRNRTSWTMLKLPYPPIRGRFRVDAEAAGSTRAR